MAARNPQGYGNVRYDGRSTSAHRLVYTLLVGPIPAGLELDHTCGNRRCVRPDHLEPVTHAENVRRGRLGAVTAARQRAKTHCPYGHRYSPENTRVGSNGSRNCRTCERDRMRRIRASRR